MTTAEEYRTAAHQLYDQALVELEAGDLRQASEKLWGAAAQVLKSSAKPIRSRFIVYRSLTGGGPSTNSPPDPSSGAKPNSVLARLMSKIFHVLSDVA